MKGRKLLVAALVMSLAATSWCAATASAAAPAVHVDGNHLVDGSGQTLRLIGVNRASFEYVCVSPIYGPTYRNGVSAGPVGPAAIAAMKTWHVNAVRVPLNEDCWLGVNPVRRTPNAIHRLHGRAARRVGAKVRDRYRAGVEKFVSDLNDQGIVAILDLHWSGPGNVLADGQRGAPDASHSVDFWRSMAKTFASNPHVVFDLFDEPVGISWKCLRDGGCPLPLRHVKRGAPRTKGKVAGTQHLVNVIRKAGATQPLMVPGLDYTDDLRRWLDFEPNDPLAKTPSGPQIVASFHNYGADQPEGYLCYQQCWDDVIGPLATQVPVVTGEFGQDIFQGPPDCGTAYDKAYMDWADAHGVSYVAWWWFVKGEFDDPSCLDLIQDYNTGEPTDTGAVIKAHYLTVNP